MPKIIWKTKEEMNQEKQEQEKKLIEQQQRRQRIKENLSTANSVATLKTVVQDIADELGMTK